MKGFKDYLILLLLCLFIAVIAYTLIMETYVSLTYSDECQLYGYDTADHQFFAKVVCEKRMPLEHLIHIHTQAK